MFEALAGYYEKEGLTGLSHSRMARYEILWRFLCGLPLMKGRLEEYRDLLMTDLYLRENVKSRPSFARELEEAKRQGAGLLRGTQENPPVLKDYRTLGSSQRAKLFHLEPVRDGGFLLFDYRSRDPLSNNARCWAIAPQDKDTREEE